MRPKRWANFNSGLPGAFVTDDYRELLARPDLDAIGVFSPDYVHEEHAVAALQAGKHVYLEKPMAISIASCDRILKAWRKSGTRLMMGFNMRYMPIVARAKQLVEFREPSGN